MDLEKNRVTANSVVLKVGNKTQETQVKVDPDCLPYLKHRIVTTGLQFTCCLNVVEYSVLKRLKRYFISIHASLLKVVIYQGLKLHLWFLSENSNLQDLVKLCQSKSLSLEQNLQMKEELHICSYTHLKKVHNEYMCLLVLAVLQVAVKPQSRVLI